MITEKKRLSGSIKFIVLLCCLAAMSACKKDTPKTATIPDLTADFTLDKTEFSGGDRFTAVNKSTGADSFLWTLLGADGTPISNQPPYTVNANNFRARDLPVWLDINSPDGIYTLELKAMRTADGSYLSIRKTFSVSTKRAKVLISIKATGSQVTHVTVDDQYLFSVSSVSPPVTTIKEFMIPVGQRIFKTFYSAVVFQKSLNVTDDQENKVTF